MVRALRGLPLSSTGRVLAILTASNSNWLVNEVFESIDPRDIKSEEYATLLRQFLSVTNAEDLVERMWEIHSLSLLHCLKAEGGARKALAQVLAKAVLFYGICALFIALTWKYKTFDPVIFNPDSINSSSQMVRPLISMGIILLMLFLWAGWKLTLVACLLGAILSLVTPPMTTFRCFFGISIYFTVIGLEFRRSKWIRNPVWRALVLFFQMGYYFRFFFTFWAGYTMIILVNHVATGGGASPWYLHTTGAQHI